MMPWVFCQCVEMDRATRMSFTRYIGIGESEGKKRGMENKVNICGLWWEVVFYLFFFIFICLTLLGYLNLVVIKWWGGVALVKGRNICDVV